MGFLGFGGGGNGSGAPPLPPVPPPPPKRILPEVGKAKLDLKARLKKMRSRALTRITGPGLLEETAPTKRPILSDLLG